MSQGALDRHAEARRIAAIEDHHERVLAIESIAIERDALIQRVKDLALERHGKRRDITAIYRWTYANAKGGTNGLIPASAMPDVVLVARLEGIVLTPEDPHPEQRATDASENAE